MFLLITLERKSFPGKENYLEKLKNFLPTCLFVFLPQNVENLRNIGSKFKENNFQKKIKFGSSLPQEIFKEKAKRIRLMWPR